MPHSNRLKILLIIMLMLGLPISSIEAQPPLEPVYRGRGFGAQTSFNWSSDSASLSFRLFINDNQQDGWFIYNSATNQLNSLLGDPSLPLVRPAQGDALGLPSYQTELFSASPNGRYLVYPAPKSAGTWYDGRSLIALTDLQANETKIINFPIEIWFGKWSEDSSAFTIETYLPYGCCGFYYTYNFSDSVAEAEVMDLRDVVKVDDHPVGLTVVYDLSADGKSILLASGSRMAIWDTTQSSASSFFTGSPISSGASFSSDEQAVFFVTRAGVYRYVLATQQTTEIALLAGAELLQRASIASISPDGSRIAIVYNNTPLQEKKDDELYILETALAQP